VRRWTFKRWAALVVNAKKSWAALDLDDLVALQVLAVTHRAHLDTVLAALWAANAEGGPEVSIAQKARKQS
jgi:hypothetical protein